MNRTIIQSKYHREQRRNSSNFLIKVYKDSKGRTVQYRISFSLREARELGKFKFVQFSYSKNSVFVEGSNKRSSGSIELPKSFTSNGYVSSTYIVKYLNSVLEIPYGKVLEGTVVEDTDTHRLVSYSIS